MTAFEGFPAVSRATAIPNQWFEAVLPQVESPAEILAFLWTAHLVQQQRGEHRFVTAQDVWALPAAQAAFTNLAGGRTGLDAGLRACSGRGELLELHLEGERPESGTIIYFVNNPASRRTVVRAKTGELTLVPGTAVALPPPEPRPGIFRLYEENVGTITPLVGERLIWAADTYPIEWITEAFRQSAERNIRNWRYIERVLQGWAEEGRVHATPGRDSFEERKQRFTGGKYGHIVRYR